jgi:hypothetical protein
MDKTSDILNEKGEFASAVSNMAQRVKDGTMSYFGNQTAKGRIDLLNAATKLKKDFLRWTGQRGVPHTIDSIGEYLRTTYNYEIDSSGNPTGETAKAGEGEDETDGTEDEGQDNVAPNGADLDQQADANAAAQEKSVAAASEPETPAGATEQPEAPEDLSPVQPQGSQGTQGGTGTLDADEKRAAQDAEKADAANANPLADMPDQVQPKTKEEVDSAIAQLKAQLYTKKVEPEEAMASIRDILASARASGGDSKKSAVDFIRRLKNDTRMTEKFPQLGAITDADLDAFNEHFERVTSAALFIVENDVRDARLVKAVVSYHLNENYGNKKLDKVQLDRVFKLVAQHMIKHDMVDFTDPGAQQTRKKPQRDTSRSRNRFTDQEDDEGAKKTTFDITKFRALCQDAGVDERDIERINRAAGSSNGDINFVLKNMPQDGDMAKKMLSAAMLSMPTK